MNEFRSAFHMLTYHVGTPATTYSHKRLNERKQFKPQIFDNRLNQVAFIVRQSNAIRRKHRLSLSSNYRSTNRWFDTHSGYRKPSNSRLP